MMNYNDDLDAGGATYEDAFRRRGRRKPTSYTNDPTHAAVPAVNQLTWLQIWSELVLSPFSFFVATAAMLGAAIEVSTNGQVSAAFPAFPVLWALASVFGGEAMAIVMFARSAWAAKRKNFGVAVAWIAAAIPPAIVGILQMVAYGMIRAGGVDEAGAFAQIGLDIKTYTIMRAITIFYVAVVATWTAKEAWLPKEESPVVKVNGSKVMKPRRSSYESRTLHTSRDRNTIAASNVHVPMGFVDTNSPRPRRDTRPKEQLARAEWQPGMSGKELARRTGMAPNTASKYKRQFQAERGRR